MSTERRYVAARPGLRFGDRTLEVGEPVPVEPGRDYVSLLKRGQIAEARPQVIDGATIAAAIVAGTVDLTALAEHPERIPPGWVHLPSLDWHQLEAAARSAGLEPPTPSVSELRVGIDASGLPQLLAEYLSGLSDAEFWEIAQTRGFGGLERQEDELAGAELTGAELPPAAAPAVEPAAEVPGPDIPAALPETRAELAALCEQLGLTVSGTGSKGFVKESDYTAALEAERARRAAPPA